MKNKKLIGSLVVIVFVLMFLSSISNSRNLNLNNSPEMSQGELINVDFPIYIKGNWSETVDLYDWCSGSGTEEDPYIIQGINVTNEEQSAYISIETAEHFIIRNVTVSNYAKPYGHHTFAGLYIEKGEYGLIDNCTFIDCSHGISFHEAKDAIKITNCKFIGSHDDPDTGLGCAILIHEAKGVNISYNDIYNYYTGIIVYDAEEIYIENNTIETTFGYVSEGGIYFVRVNDSEIINNDLYGCEFSGHEYDEPKTSSNGIPIELVDCFNIIVYGNRFFDLDGNLIEVPDGPDVPVATTPNYWIFILVGVAIIAIVVIVVLLVIKKKNK